MGEYFPLANQIAAKAEIMHRHEDNWRAQEAKVLKVLDLCRAATQDDDGVFSRALSKTCALLETRRQLQSPMIMDAMERTAAKSGIVMLREIAALSYARMDWHVAKEDSKHYAHRMTHDDWIAEAQEKIDTAALRRIDALRPLLDSADLFARNQAVDAMMSFAADPVPAEKLRAIFTISAAPEAQNLLQRMEEIQAKTVEQTAQQLAAGPILPRPCRTL